MKEDIKNKIKIYSRVFFLVITKYAPLIIGILLGLIGGIMLGIFASLTTFFVQMLIKRIKKDTSLEESIENPFKSHFEDSDNAMATDEPFEGALLVAALGVYCTGNADFSGMQMKNRFSSFYVADWISLCRIASKSKSLNGDLIVECLAATIAKNGKADENQLVSSVFDFLDVVEYEWNSERGAKPSVYLAELIQRPVFASKLSNKNIDKAYQLLGLTEGATVEEVKFAHRALVSLYHPDTVSDLSDEQKKIAAEAFLRIQAAYENVIEAIIS